MKNIYLILIAVAASFLFTGCVTFTVNADYKSNYIAGVKKDNLAKIKETVVVVKNKQKIVSQNKKVNGVANHITNIPTSFTENISKDFLSQYFNKVEVSNNKGLFEFDIHMISVDRFFEFNRPRYILSFKVNVVKDSKIIMSKLYTEKTTPPAMIESIYSFDNETRITVFSDMGLHKEFFEILETKVKPDLLKALAENI